MSVDDLHWTCPVCGGSTSRPAFRAATAATEGGVDAERFRPASADFGATAGVVVRCARCGHGSLLDVLDDGEVSGAYLDAADPSSIREEPGQVATARRDLEAVRQALRGAAPGRLVDVGCWTGSFVAAATEAGWSAEGIEPSRWAVSRARDRGLHVRQGELGPGDGFDDGAYQVVACCDVLEHLLDPGHAVDRIARLLQPGGVLFATVPDAGSRLARIMGRRWWSVLPMHVQYFTRGSMTQLLHERGLAVQSITTHPKLFSRRYYAERVAEFTPVVGRSVRGQVDRIPGANKLVGPDFRDRMALVAVRAS